MDITAISSGSKGNAYLISDGETTLLLDAGVTFKRIQEAAGYNTGKIAAALVTHRHGDHTAAIPQMTKRGMKVYAPQDTADKFPGVEPLESRDTMTIGTFTATPFDVPHDVPCFGWLVDSAHTGERLVYVTDAEYVRYRFSGMTHLMLEANYSREKLMERARAGELPVKLAERIMLTHMSIDTALGFIRANDMGKIREIYLLHLSDGNSNAADFKRQVQRETGAEVYVF